MISRYYILFIFVVFATYACFIQVSFSQTAGSIASMDFGLIEVAGTGNSRAELGTDGSVIYTAQFSGTGTGVPGSTVISGTTGLIVEIGCTKTGSLEEAGGDSILLRDVGVTMGNGNETSFAGLNSCRGLNKVEITHTLTGVSTQDTLKIGGALRGSINTYNTYSSATGGGTPVTIRVLYQ